VKNNSTLGDWLSDAEQRLLQAGVYLGHGTDNYWDEALHLALQTLGISFDAGRAVLQRVLTKDEGDLLEDLLGQRIVLRVPVPYLTHTAWFAHLPFYVNKQVLIPRSPIAEMIENGFQPWFIKDGVADLPMRILDLCCGGGCIGIACAFYIHGSEVDLADLSADALAVAKENIRRYALGERVHCYQGDLFEALAAEGGHQTYDLIVCNPPYVDAQDMATLPAEFLHEPRLALEAGLDGLDLVKRILAGAANYLNEGGLLVVEVGNSAEALEGQYPEMPFTWLEFERGGHGVFLLYKEQLEQFHV
jgi:ribosomal protein L3 glutamine methyltransferase